MTTLLIISTPLFIGIISFLVAAIAFLLLVLRVVLRQDKEFDFKFTKDELIDFAQSVTNHEVIENDFQSWLSHSSKKVRFSDN